jgi:gamma-glutamylputrescine oxidase
MSEKVTRRSFLKKSAIGIGGIAAATAGVEIATPIIVKEKMEFDRNESMWAQASCSRSRPLDTDIDVDVAVIGGGYTGLSAAYHMAKNSKDKTIAVLEACSVGEGGSGRNGGMILPQPANEYMGVYSNEKTHKLTYDLTVENLGEIESIIRESGIDCEYERRGILLVIVKENQVKQYRDYSLKARDMGIPVQFLDAGQTAQKIGSTVYAGSLFDPNGGEVQPMKLVCALREAALKAGVIIYENTPVTAIEEGEVIKLAAGKNTVRAKSVVLATNGYTSKLGYFKNTVMTVHTQIAATPRLGDDIFRKLGWESRVPFSDTYNILYHLGNTRDNRILIGAGTVEYFFNNGILYKGDLKRVSNILETELHRIYPALKGIGFEYIWDGVMGFTLDFNQSVGVRGKYGNIYYGLAYCGHGVNLSVMFGRIIADLWAGNSEKWSATPFLNRRLIPLPPEPLKWVGVNANIKFYQLMDRIGAPQLT